MQTKAQITQQHNKSKMKNTYRIKKQIVKGKIEECHSKRKSSKDELNKHCLKFPSKTPKLNH